MQKKRAFAGNLISDLICILMVFFSFVMLWHTVAYLPCGIGVSVPWADRLLAAAACAVFFALLFFFYRYLVHKGVHEKKWSGWVLLALIIAVQVILLAIMRPVPFWDELSTSEAAYRMFTEVNPSMPSQNGYFSYYGNNYPFVITEFSFCRLLSFLGVKSIPAFWPWMVGLNTLLLDAGLLIYSHLLKALHSRKAGFAFLFICMFNPYSYLCAAFVYTTTWSIFFTAVNLYLLLKLYQALKVRKKYAVLIGLSLGTVMAYGASIRVVSLIPVIAAAICIFIRALRGKEEGFLRAMVKGVIAIALALLIVTAGFNKIVDHYVPAEMQEMNFPPAHWIMMSFNENNNGGYSKEDEQMTAAVDPSMKGSESVGVFKKRFHELVEKGKLIPFLEKKLRKTWVECWLSLFNVIDNSQNYKTAYNYLAGENSLLFRSYYQLSLALIYLAMLAMVISRAVSGKRDTLFMLFILSILGGILFHLIWEANGFYSISFLFLGVVLCAMWAAEHSNQFSSGTALAGKKIRKALPMITLLILAVTVVEPLTYGGLNVNHHEWSVNSTMRRPDIEYQTDALGKTGRELKQGFEVPDGLRINIIELLVRTIGSGSPGYRFALYTEDGNEVYSQILDSKTFPGSSSNEDYQSIILPEDIGAGKYYFTIRLNESYDPSDLQYSEYLSFYYRECLGTNYNPYGELLVNGKEPEEGRSNLVFNAYYMDNPELVDVE